MNPNAVTGLGSKLNIQEIIGKFIDVEKRKVIPIEKRKSEKVLELDSWNAVKVEVEKLNGVVKSLTASDIWDAKTVESSDPSVIDVKATRRAKPGKTTIAVDAVALAHQITSQGFASADDNVGTGKITIQVGDPEETSPVGITINSAHNTLEGIRQAINDSDAEVEAFVIKTGSAEKPYQLMLTSDLTGEQGRIKIEVDLKDGQIDPPTYKNSFDKSSEWEGIGAEEPSTLKRGAGASTPITGIVGQYTGEEDTVFTFTATQGGIVNSEQGVVISWNDDQGRSGILQLNKFNYSPGQPVKFADGLSVQFSDGEVISGDSFTVDAFGERSPVMWWLSDAERAPRAEQPSDWAKKNSEAGLKIEGKYTGEDDQTLIFRVEGSGQVGGPKPLWLHYEFTETGETGKINIGYPYLSEDSDPNRLTEATAYDFEDGEGLFNLEFAHAGGDPRQLTLPNGLKIEVPPSILSDGDTTEIDLRAEVSDQLWWVDKSERGFDGKVEADLKWEPYLDEDGERVGRANVRDGILPFGAEFSTSPIEVSGDYLEDLPKVYTFTAEKRGTVGITRVLEVGWKDDAGNSGTIDFGEGYVPGSPVAFDSGLSIALQQGDLVKDDSFVVETRTSTVQRPQDALLRLGASDLGGGIEITRPTNTVTDVIPGLELELLSTSEKPVTITVRGDTELAKETVRDFVESYNTLNATVTETTKYDAALNKAGPLLSDRNVLRIHNDIANTTISSVPGLPQSDNMLFAVGLRIDEKGTMSLDESKLDEKISDDFSVVANIFRSNGESENNSISFLGVTGDTKVNPSGYEIDVTKVGKKGAYIGTPIPPLVRITEENNELTIVADGRKSEVIKLREDVYAPAALAKALQSRLADDEKIGKRRVQVRAEDNRLIISSGTYGENSSIKVEAGQSKDLALLGLVNGAEEQGQNVEGTIDGIKTTGRGQLLVGNKDTDADGLRVFVDLTEDQLVPGSETKVVVTKGIGTQLSEKLKVFLDPISGDIKQSTKDISEQIRTFDTQVKRLNERVDAKRGELQTKFAKLDGKMGRLKSQQSYLGQQLSALSGKKSE